jgi:signal peptidase I
MKEIIFEILETIAFALLMFFFIQFSVGNYRVELFSMDETLKPGDRLVANRLLYSHIGIDNIWNVLPFRDMEVKNKSLFLFHIPARGEIIIFRSPMNSSTDFVKRIIGLPSEVVSIKRGQVLIDGEPIKEPYIVHKDRRSMDPILVPEDSYFVLGDNRSGSSDSRDWGVVPLDNIVGKVWLRYWPGSELSVFSDKDY